MQDFLGGIFGGGGDNPADVAMPYFDRAIQESKGYYDPFIQRGKRSGDLIEGEYGRMMQDPSAMIERFMAGYQPSKGYQMMQDRMSQAAANTAAAGGMRGSPREQGQQQELTQGLLSRDMQQYINNILGIHTQGLAGEQGLYNTGFEGARGLSGDISNLLGTEGSLAFQGQREQNKRDDDFFGSLLSGGVALAGKFLGL